MIFAWILLILPILIVAMTLLAATGRIEPNGLLGIRTPATQRDESSWVRAHLSAARLLIPGCTLTVVLALLVLAGTFKSAGEAVANVMLGGFLVLVAVSALVADRAAKAVHAPR
jgi:uncharacterized membrane protein